MKAVILAAGQGTRIRSVHGEHPKCLIEVDNTTILDHQLEALSVAGIKDVAIVVGYEKGQIISHVGTRQHRQNIQFIENSAFAIANNIYSLWLALDWLRDERVIALNADVIFDPGILTSATSPHSLISMIVDPGWRDETMKVIIEEDSVIQMSKKSTREQFSGTYIGITVFCRTVQERFFCKMNDLITGGRVNEFFNAAVQELANEGLRVGYTSTDGLAWAGIDHPLDLTFAQQKCIPTTGNAPPIMVRPRFRAGKSRIRD